MGIEHPLFERFRVKWARFTTGFTLKQSRTNGLYLCTALLFATNQIADVLAVIGVMTRFNLCLYPPVLLISHGDGFSYSSHYCSLEDKRCEEIIILLVRYCAAQMNGRNDDCKSF